MQICPAIAEMIAFPLHFPPRITSFCTFLLHGHTPKRITAADQACHAIVDYMQRASN
jgi:hypothetical protein